MITDQKALCRDVPETPLVLGALVVLVCHQGGGSLPGKDNVTLTCVFIASKCNIAVFVLVLCMFLGRDAKPSKCSDQRTTSVCVDQLCFWLINHRDGRKSKKKCQFDVFVALYLMRMTISVRTILQDNRHIVGKPERSRRINSDSIRRLF